MVLQGTIGWPIGIAYASKIILETATMEDIHLNNGQSMP
jgi:hypothetical protein